MGSPCRAAVTGLQALISSSKSSSPSSSSSEAAITEYDMACQEECESYTSKVPLVKGQYLISFLFIYGCDVMCDDMFITNSLAYSLDTH